MKTIKHITGTTIAALLLTLTSCSEMDDAPTVDSNKRATADMVSENNNNPDESVFRDGVRNQINYVYTQNNDATNNQIFVYKKMGTEPLRYVGSTASAGKGTSSPLKSHGAVALDSDHEYLYAVNAGSNSISSFQVKPDGTLVFMHTVASGGFMPVSLTIYKDYLYVLNAGSSSIQGFVLGHNGSFGPIQESKRELSAKTTESSQICFSPTGRYLYVTERLTNTITMFRVSESGVVGERISVSSVGKTPFGFAFSRNQYMIVSNSELDMANLSSITSYSEIENGHLTSTNGALANRQTAACGIAVSAYGRFAYVTNSGNNSISAYYISEAGRLYNTDTETIGGDTPTDIVVSADNYNVYVICAKDHTIHQYQRTERGGLIHVAVFSDIPSSAAGLATW